MAKVRINFTFKGSVNVDVGDEVDVDALVEEGPFTEDDLIGRIGDVLDAYVMTDAIDDVEYEVEEL